MNENDHRVLLDAVSIGVLVFISVLGGWLAKRSIKKKLEKGLGRKVEDEDVMSISAWMKADDKVVESVVHDSSRRHAIEEGMEDCFANWAERQNRSSISLKSSLKQLRQLGARNGKSVEAIQGTVSNLHRYGDPQTTSREIVLFELAGRVMQSASFSWTPETIIEGDELIVAGKAKEKVFEVMAYRNLTRNIRSYREQGRSISFIYAGALVLVGLGGLIATLLFHHRLMLPIFIISATVFGCGLFFLNQVKKYRQADELVENYKQFYAR